MKYLVNKDTNLIKFEVYGYKVRNDRIIIKYYDGTINVSMNDHEVIYIEKIDSFKEDSFKYIDNIVEPTDEFVLEQTQEVKNKLYKQKAKNVVIKEVGDIYDLVDDLSNRLAMLERYVIFTLPFIVKEDTASIPEFVDNEFTPMIETLQANFLDGSVVDEIDLEDSVQLMQDIMTKQTKKTNIKKTEYLDKKA